MPRTDFGAFKFLTGDCNFVDYGGKWAKRVGERRYHVIELINYGEYGLAEEFGTYNVSLSEIDLSEIEAADALESAIGHSGYEIAENGDVVNEYDGEVIAAADDPSRDLVLVEACHANGRKASISDASGNNYRKLMRSAIATSRVLCHNTEALAEAMDRPVNQLGTSAQSPIRVTDLGRCFIR